MTWGSYPPRYTYLGPFGLRALRRRRRAFGALDIGLGFLFRLSGLRLPFLDPGVT